MIFQTERLIARHFGLWDLAPFVAMRGDPEIALYQGWDRYTEEDERRHHRAAAQADRDGGQAVHVTAPAW